jgi:hypothetical protein
MVVCTTQQENTKKCLNLLNTNVKDLPKQVHLLEVETHYWLISLYITTELDGALCTVNCIVCTHVWSYEPLLSSSFICSSWFMLGKWMEMFSPVAVMNLRCNLHVHIQNTLARSDMIFCAIPLSKATSPLLTLYANVMKSNSTCLSLILITQLMMRTS